MSLVLLAVVVMAVLALGYVAYGSFIARQYRLDDRAATPATLRNDGLDFVPTRPFYLLGQHFSAIAAAGPIVGPIAAAIAFGWLPSLLWIMFGVILIGAVHDFSALVASVRHGATSIAEIARQNLGRRAWLSLIGFIWIALVYVIVAFADVTANTFVGATDELAGRFSFNAGGAVAAAATMYLALSLVMGLVQKRLAPPMWLLTLIFVPGSLFVVWLGTKVSTVLVFPVGVWHVVILVYCFVASLMPIWLLLQPRGYLGGFILYMVLAVGVIGVFFGGYTIQQPAFQQSGGSQLESLLFPFLFVTIACGACSGFHGLVCGGTTSKQIARESHCKPIGFGGMLLEGFVAVIALATVMIVAPGEIGARAPGKLYGDGIASFMTVILGKDAFLFAVTFGAMAFSTFVFDTLDVATRLGRYLLQELAGTTSKLSAVIASAVTSLAALVVLLSATAGSWRQFWVLFGTSNQLLASLTLLGVTVWLYRSGRRYWYTLAPMLFVMTVTVSALFLQIGAGVRAIAASGLQFSPDVLNGFVALALLALAIVFVGEAVRTVLAVRRAPPAIDYVGSTGV
jgi:carbon starvation protein